MVFQDASDSLNSRHTAAQCIEEPLRCLGGLGRRDRQDRVDEIAGLVGLPSSLLSRLPHQLSGGQKASVGIARALAVEPELLISDEPIAALEVSIQAIVLNRLADLRHRLHLTYLFVSHNLAMVQMLCDHVVVMRTGQIEEVGPTTEVLASPQSVYTQQLLDAMLSPMS